MALGENIGTLYLCATPIGNLEDISFRALRLLKEADLVAAEDTRRTRKLFSHYDIHTPLTSYHEHNSRSKGQYLLNQLLEGKNIVLVTDAGLPGVSDPGEELTALAVSQGVIVVPVPGASASLTALVASGLPAGRFCFEGFLPARGKARRLRLEELRSEIRTLVFYESPHRLADTLEDLLKFAGSRRVCVARELTKLHEEFWRGSLEEAVAKWRNNPPRGEITIVLEGCGGVDAPSADPGEEEMKSVVLELEKAGMDRKEAVKEAAARLGVPKRTVYTAVSVKKNQGIDATP